MVLWSAARPEAPPPQKEVATATTAAGPEATQEEAHSLWRRGLPSLGTAASLFCLEDSLSSHGLSSWSQDVSPSRWCGRGRWVKCPSKHVLTCTPVYGWAYL